MNNTRKQLTLFIDKPSSIQIEKIRALYNPEQFKLIAAHITLCRENELENLSKIIAQLNSIRLKKEIQINFSNPQRFDHGKGVLLPAITENLDFFELRKLILGEGELIKKQFPHITLMHPRNSKCTNEIFETIKTIHFPCGFTFRKISLIEQKNGGKWNVLQEFNCIL